MSWNTTVLSALLAGFILSAALAETAIAQVPVRVGPSTTSRPISKPPQQEPCWEVAGVSKSAIQQRRSISQQARQEVEGVCANSSLSIQQKRQQIQQIHQRERQQIEAIITSAEQEAMRSCQEQRHPVHNGGGHVGGGGGGPCGEMPVGHKPNPQHEEGETPNDTAHPN
jgi:TolA-binding protein